jgi:hypothetical protein
MKNKMALLLLFIYSLVAIVPSVLLDEVWKVSSLVAHFQEHKAENPNLTIVNFLKLHYSQDFQAHESKHDHSKLPLKDHNAACASAAIAIPASNIDFSTAFLPYKTLFFLKKQGFPRHNEHFSVASLFDIWQPPRSREIHFPHL